MNWAHVTHHFTVYFIIVIPVKRYQHACYIYEHTGWTHHMYVGMG